jgi:hypothetical protein
MFGHWMVKPQEGKRHVVHVNSKGVFYGVEKNIFFFMGAEQSEAGRKLNQNI